MPDLASPPHRVATVDAVAAPTAVTADHHPYPSIIRESRDYGYKQNVEAQARDRSYGSRNLAQAKTHYRNALGTLKQAMLTGEYGDSLREALMATSKGLVGALGLHYHGQIAGKATIRTAGGLQFKDTGSFSLLVGERQIKVSADFPQTFAEHSSILHLFGHLFHQDCDLPEVR